jgi:hypothetical protein
MNIFQFHVIHTSNLVFLSSHALSNFMTFLNMLHFSATSKFGTQVSDMMYTELYMEPTNRWTLSSLKLILVKWTRVIVSVLLSMQCIQIGEYFLIRNCMAIIKSLHQFSYYHSKYLNSMSRN